MDNSISSLAAADNGDVYQHYLNICNAVSCPDGKQSLLPQSIDSSQDLFINQGTLGNNSSSSTIGIILVPRPQWSPSKEPVADHHDLQVDGIHGLSEQDFMANADDEYEADEIIDVVDTPSFENVGGLSSSASVLQQSGNSSFELLTQSPSKNPNMYSPYSREKRKSLKKSNDLSCPKCDREFSSKRNLKRHMRTMDSKYFGICRSGKGRVTSEEELEIIAVHTLLMISGNPIVEADFSD